MKLFDFSQLLNTIWQIIITNIVPIYVLFTKSIFTASEVKLLDETGSNYSDLADTECLRAQSGEAIPENTGDVVNHLSNSFINSMRLHITDNKLIDAILQTAHQLYQQSQYE
uniref:Uncharacterized protein n=1 Tax=Bracon brevicornis TaxID=1563983 RepID=A0A6V7M2A3_9HYME